MTFVRSMRKLLVRFDGWFARFEGPGEPEASPPATRYGELAAFVRSIDQPNERARAYLEAHLTRIARTLTVVPPPRSSGRLLEMGSYMQMTAALHCMLGYGEVTGAYYGPLGQSEAKTTSIGGKEVFRCRIDLFDAERDRYPYPDARFETVLACEIFEHLVHDPMHMLLEIHRVLEEGGALLLTTPNVASQSAVARVLEQSGNPQCFAKYADPRGTIEIPHVREYTPQELRRALECAGFEVEALFTEPIAAAGEVPWVADFLRRHDFPTVLRGEQMYCLARKRGGRTIERYPRFLYEI